MEKLIIESIEKINQAAEKFIRAIGKEKIFSFEGLMGAGKTTFIKSICKELGVTETVNSPTFSIVNEYVTNNDETIYHFDCYRIEKISEAVEIGIEEYLYSGNLCFIEWAENIAPLLPEHYTRIKIEEKTDGSREIYIIKKNE